MPVTASRRTRANARAGGRGSFLYYATTSSRARAGNLKVEEARGDSPAGAHLPVPRAHGRSESRPLQVCGLAAGAGSAASCQWHRRIAGATDGTAPGGKHKPAPHPGPPPQPERPLHRASSRGTPDAGCTCAWIGDHTPMGKSPWAAQAYAGPLTLGGASLCSATRKRRPGRETVGGGALRLESTSRV
jgi:hypothetical protein